MSVNWGYFVMLSVQLLRLWYRSQAHLLLLKKVSRSDMQIEDFACEPNIVCVFLAFFMVTSQQLIDMVLVWWILTSSSVSLRVLNGHEGHACLVLWAGLLSDHDWMTLKAIENTIDKWFAFPSSSGVIINKDERYCHRYPQKTVEWD